jgi:UDP-2,4-diacetamido-2,4,6-trideoxy-beta-L-altropyranose hydrolase
MNKRKIFFRADGDSEIGWGHITRSMVLSKLLKEEFETIFVTRSFNKHIENELPNACDQIVKLDDAKHFENFLGYVKKDDVVVLDNYFYTTQDQIRIKELGCKLVLIDDLHDKRFVADMIINHSYGVEAKNYDVEDYTKLCLGFKYALLRSSFYKPIPSPNKNRDQLNVFICFGGSQFAKNSAIFVDAAIKSNANRVELVIGGDQKLCNELRNTYSNQSNLRIHFNLNADEMVSIMDECNTAIVPSSGLVIEALSRGLKPISGYFVENQRLLYQALESDGHIGGLGNLNENTDLSQKVATALRQRNNLKSINFEGNEERIINAFRQL